MRLSQRAENIVLPLAAIVLALIIGAVLIWLDGANPFEAYKSLLQGAVGSQDAIARTLEKSTPLIFTGLAVIVGMKAGLFNIGAQGQLLLGAVFAAWVGYRLELPTVLHVPLGLLVGGLFGMLPAALAGILKAYRGAHEVITTIMLNAILISLTEWMVGARGPFHDPEGGAISRTPAIHSTAEIPRIVRLPDRVLPRRHRGHRHLVVRRADHDRLQGHHGRPEQERGRVRRHLGGPHHGAGDVRQRLPRRPGRVDRDARGFGRYESGRNVGLGFDGITVALLARINPILAIPSALLLGMMRAGQTKMAFDAKVAPEIIDVILAIILLLVCAPIVVRWILRLRKPKDEVAVVQLTSGWGA